tara:strand:- start:576 stop:1784 length:1209 start_codon:yes stop_codon:yes gene_type:complete
MKTLNRPMFRYGGPIKEGVMNGIREPKRNGGSMGEPQAINTVGSPLSPMSNDGRANYAFPLLAAAGTAAMRFLPAAYRGFKANKYVKGMLPTGKFRNMTSPTIPFGFRAGAALKENPGTALTLASLAGSGANKLLNNEPANNNNNKKNSFGGGNRKKGTSGAPGGGDPGMYSEPIAPGKKELTEAEREQIESDNRMKQMDTYKKIMNIKGMKKDATYKALIDASQLITAEGDFKGSIKDGSLIAKLIGATSKRFDKVSDTETALRSLVAKGEITKDMNKVENELKRKKDELAIKSYEKQLKGKSIQDIRNEKLIRDGELIEGTELASLIRGKTSGKVSPKVLPVTGFKTGQDPLEFATSIIMKQNNDETTPDYPEGTYIIKDRVIYVDGNGNITPVNDLSGI